MDEYSSRRAASGLVVSRRGASLLRDSAENNRDRNVQVCSRVGCSSRLYQMKDAQIGSSSKVKTSRPPFRSSAHGKEIVGSSFKSPPPINTSRKSLSGPKKKLGFHHETDPEISSLQDKSEEVSESTPTAENTQTRDRPGSEEHEPAESKSSEVGTSSSAPTNRPTKRNNQRLGLGRQDCGVGSSASFAFKQVNQGARNGASSSKYNMRNLRYNTVSDAVPSGSPSSSESSLGKKRDNGRKRIGEPESSFSARGKKMNGSMLDGRRNDNSRGISISDSRRTRNSSPGENDAASTRTRRSAARTRLSDQDNRNRLPLIESPLSTQSSPQSDTSLDTTAFSSENQLSGQASSNRAISFGRLDGSSEHMRPNRSMGPYNVGIARSFMNRDSLRQYDLDGIAEMLLALERVEQDEEPTYEQLLVLETNLFLGGLAFSDQHRDMRLDIDNMSYEELLALEERMGTVSTAVPEEALANCLKRSIYQGSMDFVEDANDIKCSVCQEEYADGDELGRLGCQHRYHIECINQWLRLKNWCPICKAAASPPL